MAIETATDMGLWGEVARQLRIDSIRATTEAGSGHPTSSMSASDLAAVLLTKYLRYDFQNPENPNNDHLVLSKGHAAPLLYSIYRAADAVSDEELLTLRKLGSRLEGHPTPLLPWVDVATGSLGQGLPIGVGIALAGKQLEQSSFKVWVILGDSEMAEGSVWEAMGRASDSGLDNLIAILDVNRLGQRGPTALQWNTKAYADRARAFGWHAIEIDGHDLAAIDGAFSEATEATGSPTMIIARTKKGKGVSIVEDKDGWHGRALSREEANQAIDELGGNRHVSVKVHAPPVAVGATSASPSAAPQTVTLSLPRYELGARVATRQAFGDALRAVGAARPNVVGIDAEVGNSTFAEIFGKAFPERYFQSYIAEQQMIATAVGMSVRGFIPFAATFATFLTRAYDFIRMAAISRADIRLCGSHAGVSIGEDGPSQMGLEDLAMMRAVSGSTVLYPSDAPQTAALVATMAELKGISYIRTTRAATTVLYGPDEKFPIGGSKVVRGSDSDQVTIVAAGITLHEALKAYDALKESGMPARVIDAYSVKPIDVSTLRRAAAETAGIVVVEDHWPQGGLGSAVLEAFADGSGPLPRVKLLGASKLPGSGTPAELLDECGISARHIVEAARSLAT